MSDERKVWRQLSTAEALETLERGIAVQDAIAAAVAAEREACAKQLEEAAGRFRLRGWVDTAMALEAQAAKIRERGRG